MRWCVMREVTVPGRYRLVLAVDVPLDRVAVRHHTGRRAAFTGDLERARRHLIARYAREGRPLIADARGVLPELYRLEGIAESAGGGLALTTSATDYAEYLLTNVEHPEWRQERGDHVMSDALGISAVLRARDDVIVVGVRSRRTHEAAGAIHVLPSGHPHPPQSITEAFHSELGDEVGLDPHDLVESRVTGILRAEPSGKPELTARLVTGVDAAEIVRRRSRARERWEFEELRFVEWSPREVTTWLCDNLDSCTPPGHAAVALAGRVDFGSAWFGRLLDELRSV